MSANRSGLLCLAPMCACTATVDGCSFEPGLFEPGLHAFSCMLDPVHMRRVAWRAGAPPGNRLAPVTTIDRGRVVVFDTLEARQDAAEGPSFVQVLLYLFVQVLYHIVCAGVVVSLA